MKQFRVSRGGRIAVPCVVPGHHALSWSADLPIGNIARRGAQGPIGRSAFRVWFASETGPDRGIPAHPWFQQQRSGEVIFASLALLAAEQNPQLPEVSNVEPPVAEIASFKFLPAFRGN